MCFHCKFIGVPLPRFFYMKGPVHLTLKGPGSFAYPKGGTEEVRENVFSL